jgi:GntR family transcriptional regulator
MHIHISLHDGVPIYRQIANQVTFQVAAERLKPGDELPSIRQLAEQLLINPNTVARAYRELESAGVVVSRRGSGTRITDNGSPLSRAEKMKILSDRAATLVAEARQLAVGVDDVMKLVQRKYKDLK